MPAHLRRLSFAGAGTRRVPQGDRDLDAVLTLAGELDSATVDGDLVDSPASVVHAPGPTSDQ
jgi:hypothetical protein